jgi:hypothetical protein
MRFGSDAILDAAGGEGGHGAARPEGVIHRHRVNPIQEKFTKYIARRLISQATGIGMPLQQSPDRRPGNRLK